MTTSCMKTAYILLTLLCSPLITLGKHGRPLTFSFLLFGIQNSNHKQHYISRKSLFIHQTSDMINKPIQKGSKIVFPYINHNDTTNDPECNHIER